MNDARRGYVPGDERAFSEESLTVLRLAARHIFYLVNEGYTMKNASVFVGNHFLLSERQRLALARSIAPKEKLNLRRAKECTEKQMEGATVHIDGFNTIITLEIALCNSLLFRSMDGTLRDLAGLRGTYRLIDETEAAVRCIAQALWDCKVKKAVFYLDSPVSNSGRLKSLIAQVFEDYSMELDVQVIYEVDSTLGRKDYVITADAIILDQCASWYNLVSRCVGRLPAVPLQVWE